MKCPRCQHIGQKSKVFGGVGTTTLAYYTPYYDEDGTYHHHDRNRKEFSYNCSKGHKWTETSHGSCQCGWSGGDTTITLDKGEE